MDEIINCPSCRRKLQLPESYMGKTVQCPSCQETFTARVDEGAYIPPSPPAPSSIPMEPDGGPEDDYPPPRRSRRRPRDDYDDYDDYGEIDDYRPRRRSRYMAPHRGGGILAMGILSLFVCFLGLVLGIIAWVMGSNDLSEMRAGRMDSEGEGITRAGLICGIIGTFLNVAGACWLFLIAALDRPGRW